MRSEKYSAASQDHHCQWPTGSAKPKADEKSPCTTWGGRFLDRSFASELARWPRQPTPS